MHRILWQFRVSSSESKTAHNNGSDDGNSELGTWSLVARLVGREQVRYIFDELGLAAGSGVLVQHALGNGHVDALLSLAGQFLSLLRITGLSCSERTLHPGFELRAKAFVALIARLVLAIALHLGLDIGHTESKPLLETKARGKPRGHGIVAASDLTGQGRDHRTPTARPP